MGDADNYPPGAYNDPRAPYNQVDPEPIDIDVTVSYSLSKNTTISSDNYYLDEYGNYNYSNISFEEEYEDNCDEYTLPELLKKVTEVAFINSERIKSKMDEYKKEHKPIPNKIVRAYKKWDKIYISAAGWTEDELCVELEED